MIFPEYHLVNFFSKILAFALLCAVSSFAAHELTSPSYLNHALRQNLIKVVHSVIPVALPVVACSRRALADGDSNSPDPIDSSLPLGEKGYIRLGDLNMCRILNGMWQVSGRHGYEPDKDKVVSEMAHCANDGYTTFDLADIYGPAEDFVGEFCKGKRASVLSKDCQFFTKWVPPPQTINRKIVSDAIMRSLYRMKTDSIDLLQFHW